MYQRTQKMIDCGFQQSKISSELPILGIIGCGNIGGRHAENFLDHGYIVYVYDIDPTPLKKLQGLGAKITAGYKELASHCEIIFTALPTPADVVKVVLEGENSLLQSMARGSTFVDISTNSPEVILKISHAMEKMGIEMLDAPFNDCPEGAKSKHGVGLAILASGPRETYNRLEPVLQVMADRLIYCGELGNGTKCKIIHNAANAIAVQAVSEGITLGLASGIALETIWDALRFGAFAANPGDINGLPHYWFSRRCDDLSLHPAFTVKLLLKDLRLAQKIAEKSDSSVPQLNLTAADYEEAVKRGWSEYAATKVRCLQEERTGVKATAHHPMNSNNLQHQEGSIDAKEKFIEAKTERFSTQTVLILLALTSLFQICLNWCLNYFKVF